MAPTTPPSFARMRHDLRAAAGRLHRIASVLATGEAAPPDQERAVLQGLEQSRAQVEGVYEALLALERALAEGIDPRATP